MMAESVVIEDNNHTPSKVQRPKRRTRLSTKRKGTTEIQEEDNKRKRTLDNFYTFCNFVLEYEEKLASESRGNHPPPPPLSPINSAGESSSSSTPSSSESSSGGSEASDRGEGDMGMGDSISPSKEGKVEYTSDDESWNLVTCFCRRPFAGRPMIECSKCQTWIHLFCARIRKDHVPDVYVCPACSKSS